MPKTNDQCYFKPTMPSPKGFGFCAHLGIYF